MDVAMTITKIASITLLTILLTLSAYPWGPTAAAPSLRAAETRCGWFENPTPANAWLVDADREWTISVQGGYQAEGDWPEFSKSQWVKTNVNYGYGCACMRVTSDSSKGRIIRILTAYAKPLSACRKDKALKGKEPGE